MPNNLDRRRFLAAALAAAAGGPSLAFAQGGAGERKVDPIDLPLDKPGIWTLFFRYKPPRIITVDGFDPTGKPAKQTVWYMWFQVYNRSGEPVSFIPEFELVTRDLNTVHLDEPQPFIFEQVKKFEDRTISPTDPKGVLNLQSTIEISKRPVPPSKPDAIPRMVSGLAIWPDMAQRAPRTNKFSVYVTGLSNGLATEQTKDGQLLILRKTLRLDFVRPTDENRNEILDIRPDDATGPPETWTYRASSKIKPTLGPTLPGAEPKKDEKGM